MTMAEEALASRAKPTMAELAMRDKPTMAELSLKAKAKPSFFDTTLDQLGTALQGQWDRTVDYAKDVPANFIGGIVAGMGDTMKLVNRIDPKFYFMDDQKQQTVDTFGDALINYGKNEIADDSGRFEFLGGELASPVSAKPVTTALKGIGLASDAVGATLKPVNQLMSKATTPVVDKSIDILTRPSVDGSVADTLKTLFVQDYKLDPAFVDLVDTRVRQGRVRADNILDDVSKAMNGLSKRERDTVQYLVSRDAVAFPEVAQAMETEAGRYFALHNGLFDKAANLRGRINSGDDALTKLNMLDKDAAARAGGDLFDDQPRSYVHREYTDREALKGNLNPTLGAGKTIPGKRGMYDKQNNFIRPFTDEERTIMKPETDFVAEKTIAKQLDERIQGELMDVVAKDMKHLVIEPDELAKKIGKSPRSDEAGYTLLSGQEFGNLNGKYVQKQTATRLKSMMDDVNREPGLWNNYRKYVSHWKTAVTIKNPKTHINNMMGNVGMMVTTSDIPASQTAKILNNGIKISGKGIDDTVYKSALEAGLLERTRVQEIEQMSGFGSAKSRFERKLKNEGLPTTLGKNLYMSQDSAVGSKVFEAYQKEDEVFKLGIYDHYLKQGKSPAEARAATEKLVFDYAKKLPQGVQYLRDTGLIPFVTWTYRSLPMFADVLKNRPAHLAATAGALALMNEKDDDSLTEPTVGDRRLNSKNWTPYMEYLDPQQFASDMTLSGIPQQAAAIVSGNQLNWGRMRTLDRKGMEPIDKVMGRAKAIYDLMPVPDVYNDFYDIATDKKRDIAESAIHRLLITNTPQTSSRGR